MNAQQHWSDENFRASGAQTVSHCVLTDMEDICQGRDPTKMRVLDFGCGSGRVTRALAQIFGEVHGVDISGRMIQLAKEELADLRNVRVHQNNGKDLTVLGGLVFDFAFAFSVFHHIPDKKIIESCIREVGIHLRPGSLFKFKVQGHLALKSSPGDTWLGAALSSEELTKIAERSGFEARYQLGAGKESFWQWFFRR